MVDPPARVLEPTLCCDHRDDLGDELIVGLRGREQLVDPTTIAAVERWEHRDQRQPRKSSPLGFPVTSCTSV